MKVKDTQFAEDFPMFGSFSFLAEGFSRQPVTRYMRPFYLAAEMSERKGHCIGESLRYKVQKNITPNENPKQHYSR